MLGRRFLAGLIAPIGIVAGLTAVCWLSLSYQHRQLVASVEKSLTAHITAEAELIAALAAANPEPDLVNWGRARFANDRRITLIAADGTVLFDSEARPRAMDNHNSRPEVLEARRSGTGVSRRASDTVGRQSIYVAKALGDGRVVRISAPFAIEAAFVSDAFARIAIASIVVAASAALAVLLLMLRDRTRLLDLRAISQAYARGDFAYRANFSGNGAYSRLGRELNSLGERLQATLGEVAYQRSLLDNALSALAEGVACIDRLDRVVYANPAYRQFAAGGAEVQGQLFYEHMPAASVARPLEDARDDAWDPGAVGSAEFEHRRRHLRAITIRIGNGIGNGIVVLVLTDITESRRAEQARRDFVSAISHELKTPLTSILGFTDTLLEAGSELDTATARGFCERIARHAQRLSVLVNDMLTLSRLEQGAWEVRPETIDLPELIRTILDDYEPLAATMGVRLFCEGSDQGPLVSDPELLRQLLGNLVSNAVRYNRLNGSVRLKLERRSDHLLVSVEDTGMGIPAEHHDRIFERFHRVDAHRSRQTGGTGLGLAIVKQLTQVLGASIRFDSSVAGSRFEVTLPFASTTVDASRRLPP
ncbi:MAG: PAS domain-containing protein [Planctomycetes bacterium]|nr:PAS domain-containing protein [Planctomycetota bacterium]